MIRPGQYVKSESGNLKVVRVVGPCTCASFMEEVRPEHYHLVMVDAKGREGHGMTITEDCLHYCTNMRDKHLAPVEILTDRKGQFELEL